MEIYEDSNEAMNHYRDFYKDMESRGFKKKVETMNQFQLDFGDEKYDDNILNAVKEFNVRAEAINKQNELRLSKKRALD